MIRLRTFLIVLVIIIANTLCSCAPYEWDGFENKEQVINTVKENIDDLYELSNELVKKFPKYRIIQNCLFKTFNNSIEYKTNLSIEVFDKLRIDYIVIEPDNRIEFVIKNKFGTYCGFYYSFDDTNDYHAYKEGSVEQSKKDGTYLEFGNSVVLIGGTRYGWYTEKICDNWYFFEEDWDNLNFIKYIYDDINNMNPPSKFYEENWDHFIRYNPYKQREGFWSKYERGGFKNKEEVIDTFKVNSDNLKQLNKELIDSFKNDCVIQNAFFRTKKNSVEYKTKLSEEIFSKLKVDYISIELDSRIKHVVKNKFGYECGFYYSFNDDKNYYISNDNVLRLSKRDGNYLEFDDRTVLFSLQYGWYTEKICDNWYFYEEDWDYLNFIKYVYDDINNMNPPSKYYDEYWYQFDRYDPHKQKEVLWTIHEKDGFNSKEEAIDAFNSSIYEFKALTNEIIENYSENCIIQNGFFKTKKNSIEYKTELTKKLFSKLRIDYISVDLNNRIRYVVKNKFGYECGFYYSFNDDKNYYISNDNVLRLAKKDGTYLEFGDKTVLFFSCYYWYTEKICDNWYFYVEDWDSSNSVKYVYDEISNMSARSKLCEENKKWFEIRNKIR